MTWYSDLMDLSLMHEFIEDDEVRGAALKSDEGNFSFALRQREHCESKPDLTGMAQRTVKRQYRSPVREQRAEDTRTAIGAAAVQLFVRDGYVATSMRAIATSAGIGERTMYDAFPTKSALYAHCLGVAIVGDELNIAAIDRDPYVQALALEDPVEMLAATVDFTVALLDRAGALIFVGIEAQAAAPELRAMGREAEKATHDFYRKLALGLKQRGALPAGTSVSTAADLAFTLGSPFVHRLLRHERGWSTTRYRAWLVRTLRQQLLSPLPP